MEIKYLLLYIVIPVFIGVISNYLYDKIKRYNEFNIDKYFYVFIVLFLCLINIYYGLNAIEWFTKDKYDVLDYIVAPICMASLSFSHFKALLEEPILTIFFSIVIFIIISVFVEDEFFPNETAFYTTFWFSALGGSIAAICCIETEDNKN